MEFIDLKAQQKLIKLDIDSAISRVLEHGKFIMGPEVAELENQLAARANCRHCITCANGTDALVLSLRALDIGVGDVVFVPSFTFAATAEAVVLVGATPFFVDISEKTYTIDENSLELSINLANEKGMNLKAVIAVDLFGRPAGYTELSSIAEKYKLCVISDAAQSFGASYHGNPVGSLAEITTTSFFPAKPLGCYGDGGAIFTNSDAVADILRSLRVHGKGSDKYDNIRVGYNSRLDTIQAAILLVKLKIFEAEISRKNDVAIKYSRLFEIHELLQVATPLITPSKHYSTWAQYTIAVSPREQASLIQHLKKNDIPTAVYYPTPLHQQTAYKSYPKDGDGLPNTENLSKSVLSLPMHAYLSSETQKHIVASIRKYFS